MAKEIMQRTTKNTCRGCRCRMGEVRCARCKMFCPDCLFDRGLCFDCVRAQFTAACRFRCISSGAVFQFQHLRVIPGIDGKPTPDNTQVTYTDHSRGYREIPFLYRDVEIVPPVPLPDLPPWVYNDGSVSPVSVRLEEGGKAYQVQEQHGILYAYEGGYLEATGGFSSNVIAWADSLDALRQQIAYWTRMGKKYGHNAREVCCDQAEFIPCVCRLSYRCPVHNPQGVHQGTHD